MKKLYTISIFILSLSFLSNAQVTGFFEATVTDLPGAATNRAVVKMRAVNTVVPQTSTCDVDDNVATDIVTGITFGIKWLTATNITSIGITGSSNNETFCPDMDPNALFSMGTGGGVLTSNDGTTKCRPFYATATPTPIPMNWAMNQWITICTLSITYAASFGPCTVCEDLDVYSLGEFSEFETFQVAPRFSFDETGSSNIIYEALPNNALLPLNLIAFEAEKSGTQDALLSWTTANEENTSHFQIQRSFDKKNWYEAGSVSAAGYSIEIRNYSFMDYQVYNGVDSRLHAYYRLNMVDLDGRKKLSPIKSVIFGSDAVTGRTFVIYPNPSSEGLQVEWNANSVDQPTALEFFDIQGKLVYTRKVSDNTNQEYIDFGQTKIQPGLYLLRILNGVEPLDHKQIVVMQR